MVLRAKKNDRPASVQRTFLELPPNSNFQSKLRSKPSRSKSDEPVFLNRSPIADRKFRSKRWESIPDEKFDLAFAGESHFSVLLTVPFCKKKIKIHPTLRLHWLSSPHSTRSLIWPYLPDKLALSLPLSFSLAPLFPLLRLSPPYSCHVCLAPSDHNCTFRWAAKTFLLHSCNWESAAQHGKRSRPSLPVQENANLKVNRVIQSGVIGRMADGEWRMANCT